MRDKIYAAAAIIATGLHLYYGWMIAAIFYRVGAYSFALIVALWVFLIVIDMAFSLAKAARRIWSAE